MLSFLLCFGVGFAMMGSPAQVNDDNGGIKSGAAVQSVNTKAPIHKGVAFTKEELQKKEIEVIKMKKGVVGDLKRISDDGRLPRKRKPIEPPIKGCGGGGDGFTVTTSSFSSGTFINGLDTSVSSKPKPGLSTE